MSPADRLRVVITPEISKTLIGDGHDARLVRRAALGQPVNASTHLQICAAVGTDPVTAAVIEKRRLGELHYPSLSAALRMKRFTEKLDLRKAAIPAGVSHVCLSRVERGEPVSIESILAICRWLSRHPFDFVSPPVARETSTETKAA